MKYEIAQCPERCKPKPKLGRIIRKEDAPAHEIHCMDKLPFTGSRYTMPTMKPETVFYSLLCSVRYFSEFVLARGVIIQLK
jgi:hypothetical protein